MNNRGQLYMGPPTWFVVMFMLLILVMIILNQVI